MKLPALRIKSYFGIKILRAILTALIILVLSFFMIRSSGDPARIYLGSEATPEMIEYFNAKWGLDKPLQLQFLSYFERIAKGDFGVSLLRNRPVVEIIKEHFPATMQLMIAAAIISMLTGVLLGMFAALKKKKPIDSGIMVLSTIGFSLPNFFFGVILIFLFSVVWGVLPPSGNDSLKCFIMPILTIATADMAVFTRFSRAAFIDTYEQGFVASFRALGVRETRILFFQALPNASISLLTISGFYIGSLVAGAIITETIFSWPGLGSLLVTSIKSRDFPLVQALILFFGLSIVVINLLTDILYGVVDPRQRKGVTD